MASRLPTEGFATRRALPRVDRINPADFAFDRAALGDAISFVPRTLEGLEQISERRFDLGTKRQTRGSRRALDVRQAETALEDFDPLRDLELAKRELDVARTGLEQAVTDEKSLDLETGKETEAAIRDQDRVNRLRRAGQEPELEEARRTAAAEKLQRENALAQSLMQQRAAQAEAAQLRNEVARLNAEANQIRANAAKTNADRGPAKQGRSRVNTDPVTGQPLSVTTSVFNPQTGVFDVETIPIEGAPASSAAIPGLPAAGAPEAVVPPAAAPVIPEAPIATALPGTSAIPNQRQIDHLRANPQLAPQFDELFGPGASAIVLGGR